MRHFSRTILSCALLICWSGLALPVQKKRYCPEPPPSPFKHNALIVTKYDGAVDRMRTTLEHPRVLGREHEGLYLSASFLHQDPNRPVSPSIELVFISTSKEFRYRDSHDFTILSDGRQWSSDRAPQYYTETDENGIILEATKVTLTLDALLGVIKAKKVEAKLGTTQFEITFNHLEALRELASLMTPQANAWVIR